MQFGKSIRSIRVKKGLKQYELAKISGISISYLSEIENEKTMPSLKTLHKIAKALNVQLAYLVTISNDVK